jgi:hypothetical protein
MVLRGVCSGETVLNHSLPIQMVEMVESFLTQYDKFFEGTFRPFQRNKHKRELMAK